MTISIHPAVRWAAERPAESPTLHTLRLAALIGHLAVDPIAARRALLLDLLSDGRPHPGPDLRETVAAALGPTWGRRPEEALLRDLNILRRGGLRIGYSRRKGSRGYYLQHPPLERPKSEWHEPVNWTHVASLRTLTPAEKLSRAFASADFALRQRRLLLGEAHLDWSEAKIDHEARRIVYRSQEKRDESSV